MVGAIAVAVWPVALALSGPPPLPLPAALAHVTGMLAGYGVVVLLALMSRAPALERGVGADRLARWHGRGGRIVVTLVLVHAVAAVTAWAGSRGVDPATAGWQVLTMPGLIAATAGTGLLLAVAAVSIRAARRCWPRDRSGRSPRGGGPAAMCCWSPAASASPRCGRCSRRCRSAPARISC